MVAGEETSCLNNDFGSICKSVNSNDSSIDDPSVIIRKTARSSYMYSEPTDKAPLVMDHATKRKLIEKRRELVQRARKATQRRMSYKSNSIVANKTSFTFNDVVRVDKETRRRH